MWRKELLQSLIGEYASWEKKWIAANKRSKKKQQQCCRSSAPTGPLFCVIICNNANKRLSLCFFIYHWALKSPDWSKHQPPLLPLITGLAVITDAVWKDKKQDAWPFSLSVCVCVVTPICVGVHRLQDRDQAKRQQEQSRSAILWASALKPPTFFFFSFLLSNGLCPRFSLSIFLSSFWLAPLPPSSPLWYFCVIAAAFSF